MRVEKRTRNSWKNQSLCADNATHAVHAHSHKHIIVIYLFGSRFGLHNEPAQGQKWRKKKPGKPERTREKERERERIRHREKKNEE